MITAGNEKIELKFLKKIPNLKAFPKNINRKLTPWPKVNYGKLLTTKDALEVLY